LIEEEEESGRGGGVRRSQEEKEEEESGGIRRRRSQEESGGGGGSEGIMSTAIASDGCSGVIRIVGGENTFGHIDIRQQDVKATAIASLVRSDKCNNIISNKKREGRAMKT